MATTTALGRRTQLDQLPVELLDGRNEQGSRRASMTLDVYADLFDEDLDSVAANLDAAIRSAADSHRTQGLANRADLI